MSDEQKPAVPTTVAMASIAPGEQPSALAQLFGDEDKPFFVSFNPRTPEGAVLLFKVAQTADVDLTECSNMAIEIEHLYAAHAVKIDPATGAEIELVRIVVIDPAGKSYGCFSQGIRKAIKLMVACWGIPPWKPAVRVTVKNEKLKNGHNWLTFYPAPILPANAPPPNRKQL